MTPNPNEQIDIVNQNISLIQKKTGLKFGTDALLLSAFIGRHSMRSKAIELGSGTGIISLLCLTRNQVGSVLALEIQKEYAELTERNAELNRLTDRLSVVCTDIRAHTFPSEVDLVFSNPPYMKVDCGKQNQSEEKFIARHEVAGTIGDFCRCAAKALKYGGSFYVVYRPDRMADLIYSLRDAGLEPKRMLLVAQTVNHAPSLVLIEAKKGGNGGCVLPRTFYLKNADGSDTDDAKELLEKGTIYGK